MILVQIGVALEDPGYFNRYYQIPYYYGSHIKERSSKSVIVNDSPSKIQWAHVYGVDYDGDLWIADKINHVIKFIGNSVGAVYVVAGTFRTSGYFDGNVVKSLFNTPSSLYIWRSSTHDSIRAGNLKPVLFSAAGASTYDWLFATKDNYTSCGGSILTADNEDNDDKQPNQKIFIPEDDVVNEKYVKFIDFTTDQDLLGVTDVIGITYVYVADTGNHCIRRISLSTSHVETIAGICGTPGFLDGPYTNNLLNSPELVSVDSQGYVFIFDDGNNYVRMMDLNGDLYTLYQGACDITNLESPPVIPFDLKLKTLICYKNWIKTFGEPSEHFYLSTNTDNYWFDFYLYCEESPLIRNRTIIET